jgi:hypothetical protein
MAVFLYFSKDDLGTSSRVLDRLLFKNGFQNGSVIAWDNEACCPTDKQPVLGSEINTQEVPAEKPLALVVLGRVQSSIPLGQQHDVKKAVRVMDRDNAQFVAIVVSSQQHLQRDRVKSHIGWHAILGCHHGFQKKPWH